MVIADSIIMRFGQLNSDTIIVRYFQSFVHSIILAKLIEVDILKLNAFMEL